jgi:cytochrome c oxidase subunit 3
VFFAIYFVMTGIHGLHVVIGMGLILWILIRAHHEATSRAGTTPPSKNVGLYWHLVDLIWIYLFPLLYLVG